MRLQRNLLASLSAVSLGAILALGFLAEAKADDSKADSKAESKPAGSWSWTMRGRQGADQKVTAKFKVEGNKLTGTITMPGRNGQSNETEIKDGKVNGDEVSFNLVRERNGTTMTTKYTGKISGDTIKGKMEYERNGEQQSRDWEAKRGEEK